MKSGKFDEWLEALEKTFKSGTVGPFSMELNHAHNCYILRGAVGTDLPDGLPVGLMGTAEDGFKVLQMLEEAPVVIDVLKAIAALIPHDEDCIKGHQFTLWELGANHEVGTCLECTCGRDAKLEAILERLIK